MTLVPKDLVSKLPHILLGGAMGGGATIAYVVAEKEPRLLIETFKQWGAVSFLVLVALLLVSQAWQRVMDIGERVIEVGRDNAAAQQRLADAVQEIARKDDERAREMELVVDHLARNSRQILIDVQLIKRKLAGDEPEKAYEHSAGG